MRFIAENVQDLNCFEYLSFPKFSLEIKNNKIPMKEFKHNKNMFSNASSRSNLIHHHHHHHHDQRHSR